MDQLQPHRESAARFRRQLAADNASMRKQGHPISRTLATEICSADDSGNVELHFQVDERFTNFFGGVQGGILGAMIDEACAYAVVSTVGFYCYVSTAELNVRIFAKAPPGTVMGKARISHLSRHAIHAEAELSCEGAPVAAGSAVILIDPTKAVPQPRPDARSEEETGGGRGDEAR